MKTQGKPSNFADHPTTSMAQDLVPEKGERNNERRHRHSRSRSNSRERRNHDSRKDKKHHRSHKRDKDHKHRKSHHRRDYSPSDRREK